MTGDAMGQFLCNLLGGTPPHPGPPWTHTITGPEIVYTKRGKVLYIPPPAPAYTLVIR